MVAHYSKSRKLMRLAVHYINLYGQDEYVREVIDRVVNKEPGNPPQPQVVRLLSK